MYIGGGSKLPGSSIYTTANRLARYNIRNIAGNPLDVRFTSNFSGAQRCFRYLGRYKQHGGRRSSFSFLRMGKRCPTQNMKWTMEQW